MADSRRRRRVDRSRLAALEVLRAVRADDAYATTRPSAASSLRNGWVGAGAGRGEAQR